MYKKLKFLKIYLFLNFVLIFFLVFNYGFSKEKNEEIYKYLKLFSQVLRLIEENYVTEV